MIIVGLKDSFGNYEGMLVFVCVVDDFDVFLFNEGVFVDVFLNGCVGVIFVIMNVLVGLVWRILDVGKVE